MSFIEQHNMEGLIIMEQSEELVEEICLDCGRKFLSDGATLCPNCLSSELTK